MTVIRRQGKHPWAFVKGAPEVILSRCTRICTDQGIRDLTESDRIRLLQASTLLANDALRVLARNFPASGFLGEAEAARLGGELARLGVSGGAVYAYGYTDARLYAFNETTGAPMAGAKVMTFPAGQAALVQRHQVSRAWDGYMTSLPCALVG